MTCSPPTPAADHPPCAARALGIAPLAALFVAVLLWRVQAIAQSGATLYVDEAQYWLWSRDLDWGYFSKPPGIAVLIRASTALFGPLFGDTPLAVKLLAMLCYPAAALICRAIARRLYDREVADWSAIAVLTLPLFSWLGLFASTDAPLTLCWVAGIWCYLRVLERGDWGDWLALGTICGLGLLAKYPMLVFVAAALLHLLAFHRSRLGSPRPWAAAGLALVLLLPNLLWNAAHDFPTFRHTAEITLQREHGGALANLGEFLGSQWLAFGPLLGAFAVAGLLRGRRPWQDEGSRLLLWFALPLWAVVAVQALHGGANANWAAPALAPASIVVVAGLIAGGHRRWLQAALTANLLLVALAYHAPALLAAVDRPATAKFNPYLRATGWDRLAAQLRPLAAAHPQALLLADSRTLLAHMAYELRDLHPELARWNPAGSIGDHFQLTADLGRHPGRDALLLSEDRPAPRLLARFAGHRQLARLSVPLGDGRTRQLEIYLLDEFQGY